MKETKFKQTEVGMIPCDWEVKPFCELFEILPNNTLSRAKLNEEYGSYKNVHYGDVLVKFGEWVDCSNTALPFINSNAKFNHTTLQDGDIVIADTAEDETVGKSTEIANTKNLKIVSGLHTIPIRPKIKFAAKWLGYYINSACWHDQILPFITGTKVSAISKAAVCQTKLFYPAKLEEQKRIAQALSDVDAVISTTEKLIVKKNALKQGVMQQLLSGKKRLPGFSGKWENYVIGESGSLVKSSINPQVKPMQYFNEYSMPAYDTFRKPQRVLGSSMHSNRIQIDGEILLFNKLNVRQQRVWYIEKCANNAVCSTEFLPYSSKIIDLQLMRQILLTDQVTADFIGMSTGTSNSQKRITPKHFLDYSLFLPPTIKEQKAIAKIFVDMDSEIAALETKLAKYRQLKTGMMQQLLTGKVRLI